MEQTLEALRAWAAEVGLPPRSYDWSPAAARTAGFPLDGVHKWEREHPRWPHHALVIARHGSWRAALQAAGLSAVPPLRIERRERVAIAQRLRRKWPNGEIADLLGVNPRTVRSYWAAGTCRRCGGPQIVPGARSCADCIPYVAMRRPSRTAVVALLKRWARETGKPPREADWRQPGGKWEREYPKWPSAGDVRGHFDTWPQALAAAGLRPHRRPWTQESIIRALRAWTAATGRPPRHDDWERSGAEHPRSSTVTARFGSWTAALRAAELPTIRRDWTAEEILDGLRAFERAHGRPPTTRDLRDTRGTQYPPGSAVQRTFGSHRKALEQLGWTAGWTPVSDAGILEALRAYAREHGVPPTCGAWRAQHRRPGASVIIRRYGSWKAALVSASEL
jgi:hypothetical protein